MILSDREGKQTALLLNKLSEEDFAKFINKNNPIKDQSFNNPIDDELGDIDLDLESEDDSFSDLKGVKREEEQKPTRSQEEIDNEKIEAIVLMKKIMPHRYLERIITMLHQTVVQKLPEDEVFVKKYIVKSEFKSQCKSQCKQPSSMNNQEVTKIFPKNGLVRTRFANEQEEKKYKQRRLVAKAFVASGYGLSFALEEFTKSKFSHTMNKQAYKQVISSVITNAYRKLEGFLIDDCHKKLTPINKQSMRKIMTFLISSTYFGDKIVVFKKFVRLMQGLSNVTICEYESLDFYLQTMKALCQRKVTLKECESGINLEPKTEENFGSQQQFGRDADQVTVLSIREPSEYIYGDPTYIKFQNNHSINTINAIKDEKDDYEDSMSK